MLPYSMLKKRLRVFENIYQENVPRGNFKQQSSCLNSLIRNSITEEIDSQDCEDLKIRSDMNFSLNNLIPKENYRSLQPLCIEEPFPIDSNTLIMIIPSKIISEEDLCSMLTFYGEIELLQIEANQNEKNKCEILVKFYDLRSAKRAFNEISYNFDKLLNIFEKKKFSVKFVNNKAEIMDKFYIVLESTANLKIIQFLELHAEIDMILTLDPWNECNSQFNLFSPIHTFLHYVPKKIIIKFFNSKEKHVVSFLFRRIMQSNYKSKFSEEQIKNFRVFIEKNDKIEESEKDQNYEETRNLNSCFNLIKVSNLNTTDCDTSLILNQSVNFKATPITPLALTSDSKIFDNSKIKLPLVANTTVNHTANKENVSYNVKSLYSKKRNEYKIVYDQDYSGIKKRNTPDEERKKYVINIKNIINQKDNRTTLMIKNIPTSTTQVELLKIINKNYSSVFNFFYLPIDFNKKLNAGYAFINFKSAKLIINFFLEFEAKFWDLNNSGNKVCYLSYARIQGFRSICEHFQKSNIMKQVDDKVKPIIKSD